MMFDVRQNSSLIVGALVANLLVISAGCGDEPAPTSPFEGTYKSIQHTRNTDGCETQGDHYPSGDDYFQLSLSSDGDTLVYIPCDEADDCASPSDSGSFDEQEGETWKRVSVDIVDIRDACDIELTERIAVFETERDVRIETRTYDGVAPRDSNDIPCDEAFARENQDQLECVRFESMLGSPVE